ncbi:bile acid:sodium symporter family protein [Thalassotalea euphylliae]|uniref:bile acid:sodium symporter family protein n=1 Tax=Thalassotalea euphylliae TaxID=1655234 RepID=UPI0036412EB8
MQASVFTEIMLPLALAFIMFGMGLGLQRQDFTRLSQSPKLVIAGLFGQIVLLPAIAFALVFVFSLPAEYAVGLIILAACPGGTMSNVLSQLAKANLALSITLTAFATLICIFTSPLLIVGSLQYFVPERANDVSLFNISLSILLITLVPVGLGMLMRVRFDKQAQRLLPYFQRLSMTFLVVMVIAIVVKEWQALNLVLASLFWSTLLLNVLATAVGVFLAVLAGGDLAGRLTLGIEVGIQNASMAMLIAISLLNYSELAVPAGIYGLTMYLGTGILLLVNKSAKRRSAAAISS